MARRRKERDAEGETGGEVGRGTRATSAVYRAHRKGEHTSPYSLRSKEDTHAASRPEGNVSPSLRVLEEEWPVR